MRKRLNETPEQRSKRLDYQRRWRAAHREQELRRVNAWIEKNRATTSARKLGVSVEEYNAMVARQNGLCAICGGPERPGVKLSIDHNHRTNVVRELLCQKCNFMIGYADENPERLEAAAEYVRRHRLARTA
jgi:hypothetical protein